jgi:predicted metal-dependent phosphotriesterase family hydrolase
MKEITTVLGNIKSEDLGFCQCHEHIMLSKGKSYEVNPALCIDDVNKSLEEVQRYHSAGGNTILEAQPGGCNRMAEELVYISKKSKVNIIASTGFHKMIFYPKNHWIFIKSEGYIEEFFTSELTKGMYTDADQALPMHQCSAKAGFIKTALDVEGLTAIYRKLFSAAAVAAIKNNRFLMVHIEQNSDPLSLLIFLKKQGMKPENLMFCHMDRACRDINILKEVLCHGVYLEFDTIGRFKYHSDEHEIKIIMELMEEGYENQLLFSLDTTRARLKAYDESAVGLDYIINKFIPNMRKQGVTQEQINKISNKNCIRLFSE